MANNFILIFLSFFYLSSCFTIFQQSLEEVGGYFEGDMNLSIQQLRNIANMIAHANPQAGLIDLRRRWLRDSNTGFVSVPFNVRSRSFSTNQVSTIRSAMNEIERHTCIRFIPRTNQVDFIDIYSGSGCWSHVGRNGRGQELSLETSNRGTCVTHGIVMHELIHALGFYHMQSSTNRDQFVRVNWNNILPGMEHNFQKYDQFTISSFDTNYDFDSLMHYSRSSFSQNGRDTITTLNPNMANRIGQRMRLSSGDIARLRNMYNCV